MSKMTEITLSGFGADGKGTLVLTPRGVNPTNGVATLAEKNSQPAIEKRVTLSVSQPTRNRKNYKVVIKASNPTTCTSTASCDPSVSRSAYGEITLSFSSMSTTDERQYVRKELLALLAQDVVIDMIDNLDPAY